MELGDLPRFDAASLELAGTADLRVIHGATVLTMGRRPTLDSAGRHVLFDGSAMGNAGFASTLHGLSDAMFSEIRATPLEVSGSYVLAYLDAAGRVSVSVDSLSQYPVYLWRSGGRIAISNNLFFIEIAARLNGVALARTPAPVFANKVLSGAMLLGCGLQDVQILSDAHLHVTRGVLTVTPAPTVDDGALTYQDCIAKAAELVERNVLCLCALAQEGGHDLSYDVTGGRDSRIVFAALLKNGLHRAFGYRSIYGFPHPDGNYAAMLAERYGLSPARYRAYPQAETVEIRDIDLLRYQSFVSQGFNPEQGGSVPGTVQDERMILLHGCFGELSGSGADLQRFAFRGRPSALFAGPDTELDGYLNRYTGVLEAVDQFHGVTTDAQQMLLGRIKSRLKALRHKGGGLSRALLDFYRLSMSRSHFAITSRTRQKAYHYPDVLLSAYSYLAGLRLGPLERAAGKVNFDILIRLMGPEVTSLPLVKDSWTDLADPLRLGRRARIGHQTPPLFATNPHAPPRARRVIQHVHALGADLPHDLRQIRYHQAYVRQALDGAHGLFSYFDRAVLEEVSRQDPRSLTPAQHRTLTHAAGAYVWETGAELGVKVLAPHP